MRHFNAYNQNVVNPMNQDLKIHESKVKKKKFSVCTEGFFCAGTGLFHDPKEVVLLKEAFFARVSHNRAFVIYS